MGDAPFARVTRIRHLHEGDVEIVGFTVDVLQPLHYLFALLRVVFVCNKSTTFNQKPSTLTATYKRTL